MLNRSTLKAICEQTPAPDQTHVVTDLKIAAMHASCLDQIEQGHVSRLSSILATQSAACFI